MLGCVLHVLGENFDPSDVLGSLSLEVYHSFRKGEEQFPRTPGLSVHKNGGFKCLIETSADDLTVQASEVCSFLEKHFDELLRVRRLPDIDSMTLDFGYHCRLTETMFVQFERLSPELLRLCGEIGLGIELSCYPPPDPPEGKPTEEPW